MLRFIGFLVVGILFGIVLTKSEAISWYRIQEMFRFQSFHMYGIIGSTVMLGAIMIGLKKKFSFKAVTGATPYFHKYPKGMVRYLVGGTLFGLGWALAGACPGPIYILVGNGLSIFAVVLFSALLGTLAYGAVRSKLPH